MTPTARRWLTACWLMAASAAPASAAEIPSPEKILGFRPGEDFKLASWKSVVEYFRAVDAASDRVEVRELGRTTEGRPYIVAIVSSEANIRGLDRQRQLQARISDPRGLPPGAESDAAISEAKPVVLITCSIHSSETASTLMATELLHDLAAGDDPATRETLDGSILLLVPSANPDGVDIVGDWYPRTLGKPWEGGGLPRLYHPYAGHDTNRDWFMLNLKETQLLTHLLYQEWFPTLTYDVHQMGSRGARLFVPPFFDPINPNLDPRINQGIFLIGAHMAADLAVTDKKGVLTNAMYDNWWNGGNRTVPQRHNMVGVLTEAASVKLASPIFLEKEDLRGFTRGFSSHAPSVNYVTPWPGGWWRLRDIVEYELVCARSILTLAARYGRQFQANKLAMTRDAIAKGNSEAPYGWVVPSDQRDFATAAEMVRILHATGIEARRLTSPMVVSGVTYPAGSYLLPAGQPFRAHLKDMMERQVYPDRFNANGTAEAPYDVAGWTLPLQMGVKSVALLEPFRAESDDVRDVEPPAEKADDTTQAKFIVLRNRGNDDFRVLNALLQAGLEGEVGVSRVFNPGRQAGDFEPSTFRFPASPKVREVLNRLRPAPAGRVVGDKDEVGESASPKYQIVQPRLGVYQPWVPSMDEGWTRLVLEKFGFRYQTIHDAEVRGGGLRKSLDAIIMPSVDARTIRQGYRVDETEPAYTGGLGAEGVEAIRAFVREGGRLICLEESSEFAVEAFSLPLRNVVKDLKTSEFYGPGSIVRLAVEPGLNLTMGVAEEVSAYFDRSLAFEVTDNGKMPIARVASYAGSDVLLSGWLLGPERIAGKAAILEAKVGEGRVVLFAFPPQHRGQTHGTFRLLFNAILAAGMAERR